MADSGIREFLADVELFAEADADTLDAVAATAERRELRAGEDLFREGDPGEFMFVVAEGALEVRKVAESGDDVLLRQMGPREVGGLTSMATDKSRSATLRAAKDAVVVTVSRDRFLEVLSDRDDLTRAVISFLSAKVRGKTYRIASLSGEAEEAGRHRVAVFDTKPYDRRFLQAAAGDDLAWRFFELRLDPATARLASGFPVVCPFVNDELGADTLERLAAEGVELVAMRCSGVNNVDLEAAERCGITVVRVPAYSPYAVAEHAVALILALDRKIHRAYNRVREGNFSLSGLVGFDLYGRTAGLVGLGAIGGALARILGGFGMEVLAHDPYADEEDAGRVGARLVHLDDLLAAGDIVSLHAPLTPETRHLIDRDSIARMKKGAMLINTSRGALVDTTALIDGLKSGRVGTAGLDVYEEESGTFFEDLSEEVLTDDVLARLMTFPNVLITSHQGFLTADALESIAATTADSIRSFLAGARGDELEHVVSPGG